MYEKVVRILISIVIALIVILLLFYGILTSEFTNIKKYDEEDDVRTMLNKKLSDKKQSSYKTKIKIQHGNMANLGDFTLSLSNNKQLSTNISLKFKDKKNENWYGGSLSEDELIKKGDILRSAVIHTLSDNPNINISNKIMRKNLTDELNNYLVDTEVEEVYFNKFIIR